VWAKGRGHTHEKVSSISRYIPKPRIPWQPSQFHRENLAAADLAKMWGSGRYRSGYGSYNSGYSTEKTKVLEDSSISIIPKHELEKYMPDISLGPKALVTPISLMSARNGHRVTHDMLHSYDAHVGGVAKPSFVDHDNILPQDNVHFAGLNAAALDCRSRIYRWLRRGPFFQEDQYFRRYVAPNSQSLPSPHEQSLFKRVVRLASKGHIKSALEEYRKITTVPPVEVYRALTAACVPSGNLGDAISIFEEGHAKLFYVARDGEVLMNLMRTAIRANNRPRVMWVYNVMRGRFFENTIVRAEIDPVTQYRITVEGLKFLLDKQCVEEARVLYQFLSDNSMLQYDLELRQGLVLQEALQKGTAVSLKASDLEELSVQSSTKSAAPLIVSAVQATWADYEKLIQEPMCSNREDDALKWLQAQFSDVDVLAVIRLARFRASKDLLAKDRDAFAVRCVQWLQALSNDNEILAAKPLTYLRKSKESVIHENLRVAWAPELQKKSRLLPSEQKLAFFYKSGCRFVTETFPPMGNDLKSMYLAQQPIQVEVSAAIDFNHQSGVEAAHAADLKIVHHSINSVFAQSSTLSSRLGTDSRGIASSGKATLVAGAEASAPTPEAELQ